VEIVPNRVGEVSRRWDDEHLGLVAAGEQIAHTPTAGFTDAVAEHASRFVERWQQYAAQTGADCAVAADGLRVAIEASTGADEESAVELLALRRGIG
jgi:hypothetical protein